MSRFKMGEKDGGEKTFNTSPLSDPRAEDSNYLPFDIPIGKAKDYPDTPEGRKKMFNVLKMIRKDNNPNNGFGIGG